MLSQGTNSSLCSKLGSEKFSESPAEAHLDTLAWFWCQLCSSCDLPALGLKLYFPH